MKVDLYYTYSNLDKQHKFGIDCEDKTWLAWVFYALGTQLKGNDRTFYLAPSKGYDMKLIKTYTWNRATDVGRFIASRILKKIKTKI